MATELGLEALLCRKLEELAAGLYEPWAREQEGRLKEMREQLEGLVEKRCAQLSARQTELEAQSEHLKTQLRALRPDVQLPPLQLPRPEAVAAPEAPDGKEPHGTELEEQGQPLQEQEAKTLPPNAVAEVPSSVAAGEREPDAQPTRSISRTPLSLLATVMRTTRGRAEQRGSPGGAGSPDTPLSEFIDELEESPAARFEFDPQGACWDDVEEHDTGLKKSVLALTSMVPRRALRVLAAATLLSSCLVPAAVYKVPWLVLSIHLVMVSWLLYLCAERPVIRIVTVRARNGGKVRKRMFETLARVLVGVQSLRSSRRREQQIKSILGTLTTCVVLFNPDVGASSIIWSNFDFPIAPVVLAVLCVAITCLYHSLFSYRERGLRSPGFSEDLSSPRGSEVVKATLHKLKGCFEANMSVWRRRNGVTSVLNDLHELDDTALNELLVRIPNSLLMQTLSRIDGTVALLCMDRADELAVAAKSRLLHALMRMGLMSCGNAEAAVENLILTTGGDDLSSLKCMQDGRGDIHSIRKLVFQDIRSREVQTRVLDHFLQEGMAQVAHRTLLASSHFRWLQRQCRGHRCVPKSLQPLHFEVGDEEDEEPSAGCAYDGRCFASWLKVIFDIDDTLMSSGGHQPAGIDMRYPKHAVYPGFTALLRELQGDSRTNQLVALSARPHMFGDIVEKGVFQRFSHLMEKHGLPTMPDLLPGALDTGIEFMISGGDDSGMRALAKKKFESFAQYLELYPEFRIVFFGDNGQGDFGVGREMLRRFPDNVEQVWIHKVQALEETPFYTADFEGPIEFVDDYVMAAISAATRPVPLITAEGLRRVVLAAAEDFGRIDNWQGAEQREAEERRLSTSFAHARQVLQSFGIREDWMHEEASQEPAEPEAEEPCEAAVEEQIPECPEGEAVPK